MNTALDNNERQKGATALRKQADRIEKALGIKCHERAKELRDKADALDSERRPDPQFTRLVDSFDGDVKAAVEWMRSYALTKEEEAAPDLLAALKKIAAMDSQRDVLTACIARDAIKKAGL